jgi:hypothetical protein
MKKTAISGKGGHEGGQQFFFSVARHPKVFAIAEDDRSAFAAKVFAHVADVYKAGVTDAYEAWAPEHIVNVLD